MPINFFKRGIGLTGEHIIDMRELEYDHTSVLQLSTWGSGFVTVEMLVPSDTREGADDPGALSDIGYQPIKNAVNINLTAGPTEAIKISGFIEKLRLTGADFNYRLIGGHLEHTGRAHSYSEHVC